MFNYEVKRQWGFHPMHDAFFISLKEEKQFLVPARVVFSSHDQYKVLILGQSQEHLAKPRGHFYHNNEELPVVGDWIAVELTEGDHQSLPIEAVLPRLTSLRRQDSLRGSQTLIANVDYIALVTSFNQDLNERRLERGIAMIEDSGARSLIVVNKSDLLSKSETALWLQELRERFQNTEIVSCSAQDGRGVSDLIAILKQGQSLAMLGMSGVGKSTLINRMIGTDAMLTLDIREFAFAGGEESLESAFEDIAELMGGCRFGDCSHTGEPGCKIGEALDNGELSEDRWDNFLKIKKEMEFHASKNDKATQSQKRREWAKISMQLRQRLKEKGRK